MLHISLFKSWRMPDPGEGCRCDACILQQLHSFILLLSFYEADRTQHLASFSSYLHHPFSPLTLRHSLENVPQ